MDTTAGDLGASATAGECVDATDQFTNTDGGHSDSFRSVRREYRARDLSPGKLQLGRSDLDQKPGGIFQRLGSRITRIQTMSHLFADDVSSHRKHKVKKGSDKSSRAFVPFCSCFVYHFARHASV